MLPHEHDEGADGMEISGNAITLRSHDTVTNAQVFQFDRVFDASSAQDEVYQGAAQPAVASVVEGFNASIIAYGQTGTGKTYTMEGTTEAPGIIPRAIGDIFAHVERGQLEAPTRKRFLLRTAYLQIYNDNVSDLLRPERTGLLIREDRKYATQCSNPKEQTPQRRLLLTRAVGLASLPWTGAACTGRTSPSGWCAARRKCSSCCAEARRCVPRERRARTRRAHAATPSSS